MKTTKPVIKLKRKINYVLLTLLATATVVTLTYGHGGKHRESFSNFQAFQQGMSLYNKLISNGKLEESWETGLETVMISKRKVQSGEEIIVAFKRDSGDPSTVYIFFSSEGKYSGSNFTGD